MRTGTNLHSTALQIRVLRAECQEYDSKKKNYDKTPNPYLRIAVGSGSALQQCDTRVVRSTTTPVYNEYLEFFVRDLRKDMVTFSMESRDGFFKDVLGTLRVPVMAAARGDVLQVRS